MQWWWKCKGCSSCVWLDYADEVMKYYESKSEKLSSDQLLKDVEQNIQEFATVKQEI